MKTIWKIILLSLSLNLSAQVTDKQAHFIVGTWCGTCCYVIGNNTSNTQYNGDAIQIKAIAYGVSGAVLLGAGKETWDVMAGRKFDMKDWGATILGGVTSVVVTTGVKYVIKIFKHKRR
jgi:hypothetical protein